MHHDRIIQLLVSINLAAGVWSWTVDGVTPSWVVYPVLLVLTLALLRRSDTVAGSYLAGIATLFTSMHLPFGRQALSDSCVHPADPTLACHPVTWLATLVVVPALTALGAAFVVVRSRRRRPEPVEAWSAARR